LIDSRSDFSDIEGNRGVASFGMNLNIKDELTSPKIKTRKPKITGVAAISKKVVLMSRKGRATAITERIQAKRMRP
jgi:hypothetical protein